MPKDTIDRAIKRGQGTGDGADFEEVRYEGYGPGGSALIVETLTDNRNRTAADVRAAFTKAGCALGETNSVSFQFDRIGLVTYRAETATADQMFEAALEAGADSVDSSDDGHEIACAPDDLNAVREALEQRFGDASSAKLSWRPKVTTPVDAEGAEKLFRLLETLEDHDDVQTVYGNYDIADDVLAKLAG
jgi:YebC/PmpR family DNA-binding regulatory protein